MGRYSLFALLLALATTRAESQIPRPLFERISIDQGLSQSKVFAVLQDRRGFIWIGTQDGLDRYDGHTFRQFKHDTRDSNSISDNYIWCLLEDRDGDLWIGTNGGGINRFNRDRETFESYRHNPGDSTSLGDDHVWTAYEDASGTLWFGTRFGGLNRFDKKERRFTRFKNNPRDPAGISYNYVLSLFEDSKGRFWVGTNGGGLSLLDRSTNRFTHYRNDPLNPHSLAEDRIWAIHEDHLGQLWVGTNNHGLAKFDPENGRFEKFSHDPKKPGSLSNNWVKVIFEDSKKRLWIGTNNGLDYYDRSSNRFVNFRHDPLNPFTLSNNLINAACVDHAGRLWIGTFGAGINKYDPAKDHFEHFKVEQDPSRSLGGNVVSAFQEDRQGAIWIGTDEAGLDRMNPISQLFRHFPGKSGPPEGLSVNRVAALLIDREDRIWIGTRGGGINRYDERTNRFTAYHLDQIYAGAQSYNTVYCMLEDPKGRFWVGSRGRGLNLFDPLSGRFDLIVYDRNTPSDFIVHALAYTPDGMLWIGTNGGGLVRLKPETKAFQRLQHRDGDSTSLSHNIVLALHLDSRGRLWVGTAQGLNIVDPANSTIVNLGSRLHLPNQTVVSIVEDTDHAIWFGTNRGLVRLDYESNAVQVFDDAQGLQNAEFVQGAALRTREGYLYFGAINGFTRFHPDSLRLDSPAPPVVITGFQIFNRDASLPRSVIETEAIELSYQDAVFSFEYAALGYTDPRKNRYAYKLEGFDPDWNYVGARRFATYTNIPPGRYVFMVKSASSNGSWPETATPVQIDIVPPYWQTWWFRIFFAGSVFGVAFLVYRARINAIENQRRLLEREVQIRTKEISEKNKVLDQQNTELAVKNAQIRNQQAQIIQSRKMAALGQMVAGLTHEINNPLTFVKGNVDHVRSVVTAALEKGSKLNESAVRDLVASLNAALEGGKRIKTIVDHLKKFTSLNEAEWKEADLNANLDVMIDLFVRRHTGISIDRQFEEIPPFTCYIRDLNQALVNILSNGVQAIQDAVAAGTIGPMEGRIIISTYYDRQFERVKIRVTDNGIGMEKQVLEKVFDPFFTTRDVGAGKGLGLTEAYGIVEKHHGHIEISSQLNVGTTVIVDLPFSTSLEPPSEPF